MPIPVSVTETSAIPSTSRARTSMRRHGEGTAQDLDSLGRLPVVGREVEQSAIEAKDRRELSIAEPCRAPYDCIEHWLDVGRRARDGAQDLAGRRLLLQGFRQVGVLLLQLGEQARVLDGDRRLTGEG